VTVRARRARTTTGDRRLRTRLHPVGWIAPVGGSILVMVAWAGVAHSSGSGWVQAVGALLAAGLLVGMVAPATVARRATAVCSASPADGQAGRPVVVTLVADRPLRIRPLSPSGPVARAGGAVRGPRTVEVELVPARRGVLDSITVELATCAPLGLLWWAREARVTLVRPLHVAPRTGRSSVLESGRDDPPGGAPERVPAGTGEPRGVRPYASGDPRRVVHWPATSHAGSLMVRESERQRDDPVTVDLVLSHDPDRAETEAERAMAEVGDVLESGRDVVLGTDEVGGRVSRWVRDRIDLGRRLARAVPPPHRVGNEPARAATRREGRG
jgi:uncharacterized protein (DUF58 family)